jgi:small-conductance mechanosensitive channel
MARNLLFTAFFTAFLFLLPTFGFSQDPSNPKQDSTKSNKIISIDQISSETETLRGRISSLEKVLEPSTQTHEVDSLVDSAYIEIMMNRDSLYSQISDLTRRDLNVRKVAWKNYKSKLKSLQTVLNDRTNDISEVNDELVDELEKWTITKGNLAENSESEDVFASLDTMILTLNSLINVAHVRLDSVFSVQKELTELILVVDEANSEINRVERQIQRDYFVLDSDPIWVTPAIDTISQDSSQMDSVNIESTFSIGIKNDVDALKKFITLNSETAIFQMLFLLLLLVVILLLNRQWHVVESAGIETLDDQTKIIFANPIASTLAVGVLLSAYFYEAVIPVFGEAQILMVFFATIFLYPKVTSKKIRVFLWLLLAAYLIEITDVYFVPKSLIVRWLLILESAILLVAIFLGRRTVLQNAHKFEKIGLIFRYVLPIYGLFLGVAVLINVIGMVNLASVVVYGVLFSIILGMVVSLAIKVITSFLVLVFKIRKSRNNHALSVMVEATNKRFQPALVWVGIMVWIFFTLKGFDIYSNITEWVYESLEIGWKIGDMRISLGSILTFIFLFVITLLIAKLLAAIFQDDWMIQTLPRGVAPAISLLLRIFVIAVGLYLAFTSAGFDLSELGFIFGALGVGIGFGLQNVVLNFIAGLILAFERPINLGDTIEVDQEMGIVTSIGVRSSNIRTYSGSEAIIPNGDLISKKVVNWTLANRDRRSKILMRTAPNADPEKIIELFNRIAVDQEVVYKDPAPKTYFYGYDDLGNLSFALLYWTTFSDTLKTDSAIALQIFKTLKEIGVEPPMPNQRNFE